MLSNVRTNFTAIAGTLAVVAALGCSTDRLPTSPLARPAGALAVADSQLFYYSSQGTPIYLTPDPEQIVFTSVTSDGAKGAADIAARVNLATSGAEVLPQLVLCPISSFYIVACRPTGEPRAHGTPSNV